MNFFIKYSTYCFSSLVGEKERGVIKLIIFNRTL